MRWRAEEFTDKIETGDESDEIRRAAACTVVPLDLSVALRVKRFGQFQCATHVFAGSWGCWTVVKDDVEIAVQIVVGFIVGLQAP